MIWDRVDEVTVEPSRENWVRYRLKAGAHIASRPLGRSVPPWFLQPGWQIPRKCGITRDAINDVEKNYAANRSSHPGEAQPDFDL
jgi:hypothetical protein